MRRSIFLSVLVLALSQLKLLCATEEALRIIKPFGHSTKDLPISPATYLELKDTKIYEGELLFARSASSSGLLSFPQEDDYFLISFENYFRKEIYRKGRQAYISKDFSLYVADIVSLYLYDVCKRQWVNPLMIISKEADSSLGLRELTVQHSGNCESLRQKRVLELNSLDVDLFMRVASYLVGNIVGSTGFYSFSLSMNGLEVLSFSTQAIKQSGNGYAWVGLDPSTQVYENGELRIKNLPLKLGVNELQIEVRDFLYRSLVFRAFIKVVKPLVR